MRDKKIFVTFFLFILLFTGLTGCESLARKFTRTKKSQGSQEVMVITPRDYSANPIPSDVMYKQYFAYWKSWNQELVTALNDRSSDKKIIDCAAQSLANLKKMASYLKEEQAAKLNVFVKKTEDLKGDLVESRATLSIVPYQFRYRADRILSVVNREFDFRHMKNYIK